MEFICKRFLIVLQMIMLIVIKIEDSYALQWIYLIAIFQLELKLAKLQMGKIVIN